MRVGETLSARRLPSEFDIKLMLAQAGFSGSSDPEQVIQALDERAPVQGFIEITEEPRSSAPPEVRAGWVGLSLPVRCHDVKSEKTHPVLAIEAMQALKVAGKKKAYSYLQGVYKGRAQNYPDTLAGHLDSIEFIKFHEQSGNMRWITPEAEQIVS